MLKVNQDRNCIAFVTNQASGKNYSHIIPESIL